MNDDYEDEKSDELEDLEDITNTLIFEDIPAIFTEEYAVELVETAMLLIDEYVQHPKLLQLMC